MAQTTFIAILPEPLAAGESLFLTVLDEVTGLSLNAVYYQMQPRDAQTYTATLPLPLNSVVKYRYVRRGGSQFIEDTPSGAPVRYRLYYAASQGETQDIIADWSDKSYNRGAGSIQGRVLNADTGNPIPNIMVNAGGIQYITDSGGRFSIQGLPAGTYNLVAYSLDGIYQPFQQGAAVGQNLNTNVELRLKPAPMVDITFSVSVPLRTFLKNKEPSSHKAQLILIAAVPYRNQLLPETPIFLPGALPLLREIPEDLNIPRIRLGRLRRRRTDKSIRLMSECP
jgi:hypothetical protein